MDPYCNKITKIKSTIDDIREDIENMKLKNEKSMSNMKSSLSKISNYNENNIANNKNDREREREDARDQIDYADDIDYKHIEEKRNNNIYLHNNYESSSSKSLHNYDNNMSNQYRDNENNDDLYKRTGEVIYSNYQGINYDKYPNYSNLNYEAINQQEDIYNTRHRSNYLENQISELHNQVDELERRNSYLQMALAESRKDYSFIKPQNFSEFGSFDLDHAKKNENLIEEIKSILKVSSYSEILCTLEEWSQKEKKNKFKSEFIEKLWDLYKILTGEDKETDADIVKLWRWIKYIVKEMKVVKERNPEGCRSEDKIYKRFCDGLIHEFNLQNFEEFENFIYRLLDKNQTNQKRVEKIKKLLLTEPNAAKFKLSYETAK